MYHTLVACFYHQFLVILICPHRLNEEEVRLMLWDTAGQEEFDAITKSYYRGELDSSTVIWSRVWYHKMSGKSPVCIQSIRNDMSNYSTTQYK